MNVELVKSVACCLSAGQQPPSLTAMDPFDGSSVTETLRRVSAELGCSPTSADVAAYLDKHDKLRHLREQFLVPKIADLPPCEWIVLIAYQCSVAAQSFKPMKIICISLMSRQLILCWSMAPKNASTWWGTLWGFSPKRPGITWKRSWRSGPKRTYSLLNSSFIKGESICGECSVTVCDINSVAGASTVTREALDPGPGPRTT